jgi:hypothetical protein|tara:strand:- start:1727 stop:2194 length:468 start_codon:yes stop_codon:yes gene_type:complete
MTGNPMKVLGAISDNIVDGAINLISEKGLVEMTKAELILDYHKSYPESTVKQVAKATSSTTSYVRNTIKLGKKKKPKQKVLLAPNQSDGSTASYYELPKGAKELQHLISHRDMNSQIGEIFRACYRYGEAKHSSKLRDAKKIKFYIDAEIARLEL